MEEISRSQQMKKAAAGSASIANVDTKVDGNDKDEPAVVINSMDVVDPVDILSKLPKDFYGKLEEEDWHVRKEALEALEVLLKNPKIANGDYRGVVIALRNVIANDPNVVLVAMAGKSLAALARGLNKNFSPYALACVSIVLEKFKEKKAQVVTALRECMDAMYPSLTLEKMEKCLVNALNSNNPSIKTETCLFLGRAFTKTLPAVFNKKLLETFVVELLKTLNESDPAVRDASAETLGTLQKLLGEKTVAPHLVNVDPLKLAKIKECAEKVPAAPKSRPATAPSGPSKPAHVGKSAVSTKICPVEPEMTPEEVDERATNLLPTNLLSKLVDENWMTRLSASETFLNAVGRLEMCETISQILIRALCKKPGLKENNFQVLKLKLNILKKIVEVFGISTTTGDMILNDVVETLGDDENSATAAECLLVIARAVNLEYVIVKMLSYSLEQKSPKVQMKALQLTGEAIQAFGIQVQPKKFVGFMKKALQSVNATVHQATITTLGIIYLHTGDSLMEFFDGENERIKQQIQAEFQKFQALQKLQKATRRTRSRSRGRRSNSRNRSGASRKRSKSRSRSRKRSRSRRHSRKSKKRSSPKRSRSRSKRSRTPKDSRSRSKRSRSPKDRRKRSRSRQKSSSRYHRKSSLRDDRSSRRSRSRSRGSRDRHRSRKHDRHHRSRTRQSDSKGHSSRPKESSRSSKRRSRSPERSSNTHLIR